MRLLMLWMVLLCSFAKAEEAVLERKVKAGLVFELEEDPKAHYPHLLKVFLRMENRSDSQLQWLPFPSGGIEAELLDQEGKPVPQGPGASSVTSGLTPLILPYGSRLDWLISHGGVSMAGDTKRRCALVVGGKGWLLPMAALETYSLKLQLRGGLNSVARGESKLLLDLPAAKIVIGK